MATDLRNAEARKEETRKVSKGILERAVRVALSELEFLINATPTGPARNELCDANIHIRQAACALGYKL